MLISFLCSRFNDPQHHRVSFFVCLRYVWCGKQAANMTGEQNTLESSQGIIVRYIVRYVVLHQKEMSLRGGKKSCGELC